MAARQEVTFIISARDRTDAAFRNVRRRLKRLREAANSLAGRLAAVLGAGAIIRGVTRTAKGIDEIAKAAKRLGVGVGFLSRFAFAAELAGANLPELERGMRNLSRTSAEAAIKGGETAEAYKRLGLDAKALIQLDPATRFLVTATALGKLKNEALQTEAAQRLLGRSGTQLIPLMELIASDLQNTADAAEEAGAVVNEKLAKSAEDFTDQLVILNAQLDLFYRKLLQIANDKELLTGLGQVLELAGKISGGVLAVGGGIGTATAAGVEGIGEAVERLERGGSSETELTLRRIRERQANPSGEFILGQSTGGDPAVRQAILDTAVATKQTVEKIDRAGSYR